MSKKEEIKKEIYHLNDILPVKKVSLPAGNMTGFSKWYNIYEEWVICLLQDIRK